MVGICASGKTTLVAELAQRGFDARQCGQEHSYVPDMWRRISRPQILVYLDASPETVRRRRAFEYPLQRYQRQTERLRPAGSTTRNRYGPWAATSPQKPRGNGPKTSRVCSTWKLPSTSAPSSPARYSTR